MVNFTYLDLTKSYFAWYLHTQANNKFDRALFWCQKLDGLENTGLACLVHAVWMTLNIILDNKVHGANMGPTWVLPAPDVAPMLAPWTLLSGYLL